MKTKYTKVMIAAAAVLGMSACANHDLIPEISQVGQAVPTVYWEVGSTVCKAGDSFTFQGKYTSELGRTPIKSEVWYQVLRSDVATATAMLGGTSLSYTQTVTSNDTMRAFQCHASFPHKAEYWNGHEFIVTGSVPTSRTLSPVSWVDAAEWDVERFNTYYPEGFTKEFLDKVVGLLTDASTASGYYNALRTVYLNYPFTNEQFAAVGLPQLDLSGDDNGTSVKSDAWFWTKEESDDALVGKYYITLDENNNPVYNEVGLDYTPTEGQHLFNVYKSSEWVFCRYDDNTGGIAVSVRPEWLPKFRTLISAIAFQDWIFDSANAVYKIEFSRNYSLEANFRAYDKDMARVNDETAPVYEGITSATEQKTISIN